MSSTGDRSATQVNVRVRAVDVSGVQQEQDNPDEIRLVRVRDRARQRLKVFRRRSSGQSRKPADEAGRQTIENEVDVVALEQIDQRSVVVIREMFAGSESVWIDAGHPDEPPFTPKSSPRWLSSQRSASAWSPMKRKPQVRSV